MCPKPLSYNSKLSSKSYRSPTGLENNNRSKLLLYIYSSKSGLSHSEKRLSGDHHYSLSSVSGPTAVPSSTSLFPSCHATITYPPTPFSKIVFVNSKTEAGGHCGKECADAVFFCLCWLQTSTARVVFACRVDATFLSKQDIGSICTAEPDTNYSTATFILRTSYEYR